MKIFKGIAKIFSPAEGKPIERIPGRNEQCWCGSGKKYKKCHLNDDEKKASKNYSPSCGSA